MPVLRRLNVWTREMAVRLAEYVVSYSLETNSRCLRYLAEMQPLVHISGDGPVSGSTDGPLEADLEPDAIFVENILARDCRRLCGMWSLVGRVFNALKLVDQDDHLDHHVALINEIAERLTEQSAIQRLTLKLASQATEDEEATRLMQLARLLPVSPGPAWAELNDVFADDSALWRDHSQLVSLPDQALLDAVRRTYRQGYKLKKALLVDQRGKQAKKGQKRAILQPGSEYERLCGSLGTAAQELVHHLELLRPGLSDKGKRVLWYVDKLAEALRLQSTLTSLKAALPVDLEAAERAFVEDYLSMQQKKVRKRIELLLNDAYPVKHKRMGKLLEESAASLGVQGITSLSSRPASRQAAQAEVATEMTTDKTGTDHE